MPDLDPEILVIGAGPGGSAAAWSLAREGHDVLMVDRATFPRDKTCGDGLTPLAVQTLYHLGVYDQIEAAKPSRIDRVRIVGPFGAVVDVSLADHMITEARHALVLPRLLLDDILRQHAIAAGAAYRDQVTVKQITRDRDRITSVHAITPDGPIEFRPRHVVIAVGANMGLLKNEGFLKTTPRLMRAARGYFSDVRMPSDRYDFFYDFDLLPGYGWIFPLGEGRANVGAGTGDVFWASRKTAQSLMDGFIKRRGSVMSHAEPEGALKGFPLRVDFLSQQVAGENWIIIGEAAGLVNPMTGEGIDLAMESGLIGARLVHEDIAAKRRTHISYQREMWHRYGPQFNGLRTLRDILINPFFMDYVVWQTRNHRHMTRIVLNIAQGSLAPQAVFNPLFMLQFFIPITPPVMLDWARQLFEPRQRRTSR